jgi:enoyl-CoA hydratase/carnithine racemase
MAPRIERDGDVAVLNIGDDENRFTVDWLAAMHGCLDEVEAMPAPVALVTLADGKFWSNGLDLDWLTTHVDQFSEYVTTVQSLFSRMLTLGVPTVAAIQGHCFAAGGILALAHDWRVMRADRGFFCLPEVDINMSFPVGMDALIRAKLPIDTALEAMTTGRRYGGTDARAAGIVHAAVDEAEVRAAALEIVRPLAGKAGATLATIKRTMFAEPVALLAEVKVPSVGD